MSRTTDRAKAWGFLLAYEASRMKPGKRREWMLRRSKFYLGMR